MPLDNGLHETQSIDFKFNYGIANRGASVPCTP